MATTNTNNLILAIARRLKDARISADPSDDAGKRFSSKLLTEYLNKAIRDFLVDKFITFGEKGFMEMFPEYVKTGTSITLTNGVVPKPYDAFTVVDLRQGNIKFRKIRQDAVNDVILGIDPLIIPSSNSPVFYEENGNIYTLGITSGSVIPRYIKTHTDLVVSTASSGNGKYSTSPNSISYDVSTSTISGATMNTPFSSSDVNKRIMFNTNSAVYTGVISSYISSISVTISGDNLPSQNINAGGILSLLVADNDINDITINPYWYGEIIERAVVLANEDVRFFNQQS